MSDTAPARTILAVDDHALVRMGLRQLIQRQFGDRFQIEEAHSLAQALQFLQERAHEVLLLLLDLNLGDARGLSGLRLLRQRYPRLRLAVVSGTHDARVRDEALALGALDYFIKSGEGADLEGLLERIARAAQAPEARPAARPTPAMQLSQRQVQVLELLLGGLDNQAIAAETGLALGSVKNCVSAVFLAFNVRSRAELMGLFA